MFQVGRYLAAGDRVAAQELSKRLSDAVAAVFELAKNVPDGNVFANANKAMDHYFAHGPEALGVAPPRLHTGRLLPTELIRATGEFLRLNGLMPARGYLELNAGYPQPEAAKS